MASKDQRRAAVTPQLVRRLLDHSDEEASEREAQAADAERGDGGGVLGRDLAADEAAGERAHDRDEPDHAAVGRSRLGGGQVAPRPAQSLGRHYLRAARPCQVGCSQPGGPLARPRGIGRP